MRNGEMGVLGLLVVSKCLATTREDHEVPRNFFASFHSSKKMLVTEGFLISHYITNRRPFCLALIYSKPEPVRQMILVMIHENNMTTESA
ncbi:hypothetical protein B9Z19DRAFT_1089711 [Tuber borchii]|uniref:Secreted protein n=1 Tax=Tuber borchii TaxID=42251 RepID=A0A2T6ZJR3_TUBBO|nr:hypothetical protein B9Z19DRAFT_1089711 [Tuber borchii]